MFPVAYRQNTTYPKFVVSALSVAMPTLVGWMLSFGVGRDIASHQPLGPAGEVYELDAGSFLLLILKSI